MRLVKVFVVSGAPQTYFRPSSSTKYKAASAERECSQALHNREMSSMVSFQFHSLLGAVNKIGKMVERVVLEQLESTREASS